MSAVGVAGWVLALVVLVAVAGTLVESLVSAQRKARLRSRLLARRRTRVAELAAIDAAIDDPVFSPERIRGSVSAILELAGRAGEQRSPELSSRADGDLIRAWADSRRRSLTAAVRPVGLPAVDILRVVNRGDEKEDRVVARVRFRVDLFPRRSAVPPDDRNVLANETAHLDERWTLVRRGEDWLLASVDGDPLARPLLSAPLISSPSQDQDRVAEQSLRELASQSPASLVNPSELVDAFAPAQRKLLDLSVVDDRFSPLLIAAAVKHIVDAWEAASDDSEAPLLTVATWEAATSLLYQGQDRRRFIRDVTLRQLQLVAVFAGARPPKVHVSVTVNAAVYFTEGGRVVGSASKRRDLRLRWTLELHSHRDVTPRWRLTETADA